MASGSVIQHNISALNSSNYLVKNNNSLSKNLEKLSSGYRINRAGDDAAGLAISEKMRSQITGLDRANLNTEDGVSLIQTAEGALTEVHSMLNRLVELGTESANGVYQASDREKIQDEVDQILEEIDRISESTNFNGIKLLDGSLGMSDSAFNVKTLEATTGTDATKTVLLTQTTGGYDKTSANYGLFDIKGKFSASGSTDIASCHTSTARADQVLPSFEINLKDLAITFTAGTSASSTVKLTLTIGKGNSAAGGATAISITISKNMTTSEIASAIAQKINTSMSTGTQINVAASANNKGGYTFTAVATGSVIKFVAVAGQKVMGDATVGATIAIGVTKDNVDVTKTLTSGSFAHALTNTVDAVEMKTGGDAGITLSLTKDVVKDGASLTIEDKTFVFKVGLTSTTIASAGQILIDLTAIDKDQTKTLTAVAGDRIAQAVGESGTATFYVESNGKGKIHIDQKETDNTEYREVEDLVKLFKFNSTAAQGEGVNIDIDASKLKSGDAIRVDGKTYQFVGKGEKAEISGATAVQLDGLTSTGGLDIMDNTTVAQALQKAIGNSTKALDGGSAVETRSGINNTDVTGGGLTLQIGDTDDAYNKVTVAVDNMSAKGLGLEGLTVTDQGLSAESITKVNKAIEKVSVNRGRLGALQNRLEHTQNNLSTTSENMTAAESSIRDVDMAKEMMSYTKNQVLVQAAQSMLAQANQQPQQVLQLLR